MTTFDIYPRGTRFQAGLGIATVLPDMDFETYSEAGYVWNAATNKWDALPGASQNKKGLTIVGAAVYAQHPSTEVLSFAYDLKDGHGKRQWLPGCPAPQDLFDFLAAGGLVEAWNSAFEWWIWNYVCTRRYGWPSLDYRQLRCAMAKARAFALPGSLEKAGEVLQLTHQKDKDGDRLLKKFSVPQNPTKARPSRRIHLHDDPPDAERLLSYNLTDIVTESEASARVPDLDPDELQYWLMDQRINRCGVQMDVAAIDDCISIIDQAHDKYNRKLYQLTNGAVARASELAKLQVWLSQQGVTLPSVDEETVTAALKTGGLPDHCARALKVRQAVGSAAVKKLYAMALQVSDKGRLHDLFTYYGARTGRTTGNGPQPTNLPNHGPDVHTCWHMTDKAAGNDYNAFKKAGWTDDQLIAHGYAVGCKKHFGTHRPNCPWCGVVVPAGKKPSEWKPKAVEDALAVIGTRDLATVEAYCGDAVGAISGCLRGLFVAAEGYDLICSDYSAIEAVVLAMIAGVQWRIDVFRTHGKIYEASAAMMAKISVEEVLEYKTIHGKHHPLRDKGKRAELACGYGGWVGAWIAFGADKYMTEDEMKTATLEWRAASPEIPEFWGGQWRRTPAGWVPDIYGVEGAFLKAILSPGEEFEYRGFKFQLHNDVLYLRLLSGRHLKYHRPRLMREEKYGREQFNISYEGWNTNPKNGAPGWVRIDTYGGRLTENIVQATARDIQWFGMLNLERAGYPIVLHVYDEDIAEIPKNFGSIEEFEKIMSTMPPWAHDWPIKAAGGWRGRRYRKD
jgi:DNA polymerase bacteriophage-type